MSSASPRYLDRPQADTHDADATFSLPYGMTADGTVAGINEIYAYLHALNRASIDHGYPRLVDLMQPAGFSGLLSQLLAHAIARQFANAAPGLVVNQFPNGWPDLVPRALYATDAIQHGDEGVEVKVSRFQTSWQGHNPERGWIMIAQVSVDRETQPVYDRVPTTFERLMLARLELGDWTFAGRGSRSRRTPTASINQTGREKLLRGIVYRRGGAPPVSSGGSLG